MHDIGHAKAIDYLRSAVTDYGILASTIDSDNYRRVWSRDGIIAGLAGLIVEDQVIIQGLKNTLLTLASNAHPITGAIPSNVDVILNKTSYGSLAGRVDATTWFLIGAAQYGLYSHDAGFYEQIEEIVIKCLTLCDAWEFNGRHLIYTPLSGNWADEYPLHGYLLYDNILRYWAVKLWATILDDGKLKDKAYQIFTAISNNFWLRQDADQCDYHPSLFQRSKEELPYMIAGFHPGGMYKLFDAAGNGLAMLLGLNVEGDTLTTSKYVENLWEKGEVARGWVPAFWPVINKEHHLYKELTENYSYDFKNKPYHFHNGGIWPVMMGLLALGFKKNGVAKPITVMLETYSEHLIQNDWQFYEYIDSEYYAARGKYPLSYSASGYIFMNSDLKNIVT